MNYSKSTGPIQEWNMPLESWQNSLSGEPILDFTGSRTWWEFLSLSRNFWHALAQPRVHIGKSFQIVKYSLVHPGSDPNLQFFRIWPCGHPEPFLYRPKSWKLPVIAIWRENFAITKNASKFVYFRSSVFATQNAANDKLEGVSVTRKQQRTSIFVFFDIF